MFGLITGVEALNVVIVKRLEEFGVAIGEGEGTGEDSMGDGVFGRALFAFGRDGALDLAPLAREAARRASLGGRFGSGLFGSCCFFMMSFYLHDMGRVKRGVVFGFCMLLRGLS